MRVGETDQTQVAQKVNQQVKEQGTDNINQDQEVEQLANEEEEQNNHNQLSKEEMEQGLEQLNEAMKTFNENLKFKLHEKADRMKVEVVDTQKDEVIKEIPSEEMLDMIGRIREMVGLIVDEKI